MLPSGRPHGSEDGADDSTTNAHEGDHDDEPANGDGLSHDNSAARFTALLAGVHRSAGPGNGQRTKH